MSALLDSLVGNKVEIITNDGRVVVGILKGLDQVVNVVLANTEERVFTSDGVDRQPLGLYLIRGDNVAIVGKAFMRSNNSFVEYLKIKMSNNVSISIACIFLSHIKELLCKRYFQSKQEREYNYQRGQKKIPVNKIIPVNKKYLF